MKIETMLKFAWAQLVLIWKFGCVENLNMIMECVSSGERCRELMVGVVIVVILAGVVWSGLKCAGCGVYNKIIEFGLFVCTSAILMYAINYMV